MSRWNLFVGARWRRIPVGILAGMVLLMICPIPGAQAETPAAPAWDQGKQPISIITNGWVDVREILRHVAANGSLGLQMAPDVTGQVNVHLEDVGVRQALDALLDPVDLGYEVVNNVLVVYKRGMVTRWFTFDYPVTQREGRGELEISVSREGLSNGGGSGGGGGGGSGGGGGGDENQNRSHVTSTAVMSVWPQVMESLTTLVFPYSFESATQSGSEEALSINRSDADGRLLVVNPMASLVQVTAEWDRVEQVDQLLLRLKESLLRQVAIEVRIMEVSLDDETRTGVNWNTILNGEAQVSLKTINPVTNIGEDFMQIKVDSKHLAGVLQALATTGDLKTISTPRVTTLNNQKAIVRVVREDVYYLSQVEPAVVSNGVATEPVINYTPITVPVGVVLDVTPQIGKDRIVTLNVHPTISDVVGLATSPNEDTAPVLSVRELDTVGKVHDGETLIIAGLMSERTQEKRSGVPLLKDLPLLGYLFGQTSVRKQKIELVILLTPVIMDGPTSDELAQEAQARMEDQM